MIDGPSTVDPLVSEGPVLPRETLRPLVSLQRMVLLDQPGPLMVDLATGDVRRYENGPPVSVPMVSNVVDLSSIARLQVQVLRDPRPTSTEIVLFSLHLADAGAAVQVCESLSKTLTVRTIDGHVTHETDVPIGTSEAIVIAIEHTELEDAHQLTIRVRNAENLEWTNTELTVDETTRTTLTVGGPNTARTGLYGRTRMIPVLLEVTHHRESIDQVRRVLTRARRAAGSLRSRAV